MANYEMSCQGNKNRTQTKKKHLLTQILMSFECRYKKKYLVRDICVAVGVTAKKSDVFLQGSCVIFFVEICCLLLCHLGSSFSWNIPT